MNKKLMNYLCISLSLILFIYSFKYTSLIKESIINSITIYFYNVLPSLFISNIIINIISQSNIDYYIYKYTNNIYLYIIFISFLCGSPISSILINNLYKKNYISKNDINYLICFTTLNNPIFIYFFLSKIISKYYTITIIIIIYIYNIIIYLIYRKKLSFKKITLLNNSNISISKVIKDASLNQIPIIGTILFFSLIIDILSLDSNCLVSGLIEVTKGLNCVINSNLNINNIISIITSILLFNSLSIHIQISNILPEDTNYKYFYTIKIIMIMICLGYYKMRM